ncbi:MAG TPA: tetratricopeptide repeat protein [Flavobacterium sp.]|nr:tetratricopeptide repeat protein [Flavobacterium sp.]
MKHFGYMIFMLLFAGFAVQAQTYKSQLADGNQRFGIKNYTEAEQSYRKAAAKDKENTSALYNKANSIYRMESMNEAVSSYQTALKNAQTKEEKHRIFHNMGNAFMNLKDYRNAVEAYKNALRNKPSDEETRYNYALAKKMLEDNQDQDNQNEDNKQDQQNEQDQNQDDQNQDQKDNEDKQDQKDQEEQQNKDEKQKEEQPKPQQQKQEQTKQQMENMLKAIDDHEQSVRERIQKREQNNEPVSIPSTKDW